MYDPELDEAANQVRIWTPSDDGASGKLLAAVNVSAGTVAIQVDRGDLLGGELAEVRIQLTRDGVFALVEQRDGESAYTRVWAPAALREPDDDH